MSGLRMQSITLANSGRLSIPVKSAQTMHAQFKYVYGKAARSGQTPVALARLRHMNSYIANFKSRAAHSSISFSIDKTPASSIKKYRNIANPVPPNAMDFGVNIDTRA